MSVQSMLLAGLHCLSLQDTVTVLRSVCYPSMAAVTWTPPVMTGGRRAIGPAIQASQDNSESCWRQALTQQCAAGTSVCARSRCSVWPPGLHDSPAAFRRSGTVPTRSTGAAASARLLSSSSTPALLWMQRQRT